MGRDAEGFEGGPEEVKQRTDDLGKLLAVVRIAEEVLRLQVVLHIGFEEDADVEVEHEGEREVDPMDTHSCADVAGEEVHQGYSRRGVVRERGRLVALEEDRYEGENGRSREVVDLNHVSSLDG